MARRGLGRGFAAMNVGGVASGQDGLKNLRLRLQEIDGDLQHESRPGSGTRLILSVKLPTGRHTGKPGG